MSRTLLAHAVTALSQTLFGGLNVLMQIFLDAGVNPYVFGFYRDLVACPLLIAFASSTGNWKKVSSAQDTALLCALGVFGLCGNQLLYLVGLSMTDAVTTAIYQSVTPVVTAIRAVFPLGQEPCSPLKLLGVVTGVAGSIILIFAQPGATASSGALTEYVLGNGVLIAQVLCYSSFFLLQKPLLARYPAPMVIAASYVAANVALALCCLPLVGRPVWGLGGYGGYLALLYSGVLCSAASYALMTWANRFLDASITSCYAILQPVSTGILAYFFLGKKLDALDLLGCVLVLAGLVLSGFKNVTKVAVQAEYEKELLKSAL